MRKYFFHLSIALLLLSACAPRTEDIPAPAASLTPVSTDVPATVMPTGTPVKKFVPKQNDLIFIEFFSIT